ncbi:MAG: cytidine deaminase [Patescibacteria group bacterium]
MAENRIIQIPWQILDPSELTAEEEQDLRMARTAREDAHAPYSNFAVGAAVRNANGVFIGWNVENAIYDVLHAEENAIGRIPKASRQKGIKRITVAGGPVGNSNFDEPISPCGACRQKVSELLLPGDNPAVIMGGVSGNIHRIAFRDLLPLGFFPESVVQG